MKGWGNEGKTTTKERKEEMQTCLFLLIKFLKGRLFVFFTPLIAFSPVLVKITEIKMSVD